MGRFFDKQPASRLIKQQNLAWAGSGTLVSTLFAGETFQVRVCSQVAGWFNIDVTGSSSTPTTAGGIGYFIPASTVGGEYFIVSPSQILSFSSTSTSSGVVSVAEVS
jgi:hypothetical protein